MAPTAEARTTLDVEALVQQADIVVVARVLEVTERELDERTRWSRASLELVENLKGYLPPEHRATIWQPPPAYPGDTFLESFNAYEDLTRSEPRIMFIEDNKRTGMLLYIMSWPVRDNTQGAFSVEHVREIIWKQRRRD